MEILRGSDNLDGNNKQVKYDQNGFIYDNYDKYEQLFAKVKDKKDEYSIEKMASKYLEAYKSLLK
mgnify:CR=1 FL=1